MQHSQRSDLATSEVNDLFRIFGSWNLPGEFRQFVATWHAIPVRSPTHAQHDRGIFMEQNWNIGAGECYMWITRGSPGSPDRRAYRVGLKVVPRQCRTDQADGSWRPVICSEFREWRAAMAGSVNKVILIGNLGADPEIKRTQDGRPIANLRIATSDTWRDKATGERKEKTEWHRVVIFSEGLCKIAEQYLKKGAKVYIEGAAADPQMDRPERRREILDRSGAAELQLDADHARRPQRRRRGGNFGSDDAGGDFGSSGPSSARAAPRGGGRRPQQRHGRRYSVLRRASAGTDLRAASLWRRVSRCADCCVMRSSAHR